MSNYLIKSETLTNIANAIRTKTGKTDSIATENMATEISGLPIYPLYDGAVEEINLAFALNSDGASYSVSGIGEVTSSRIVIPDTYKGLPVTEIGVSAFMSNKTITSVYIPDGVKKIGTSAFFACSELTLVVMPNTITSMGNSAFHSCEKLNSINISNRITTIGQDVFKKAGITYIEIPDSVTTLGIASFREAAIEKITLPSVKTIGNGSFLTCTNLKEVIIGESINSIGVNAFGNCNNLISVTVLATTPPALEAGAIYTNDDLTIYVPAESVEAYKTATNWSAYADKIQAIQN